MKYKKQYEMRVIAYNSAGSIPAIYKVATPHYKKTSKNFLN